MSTWASRRIRIIPREIAIIVPPAAAASSFTDVDANAAYAKAVDWANETKITTGTGDGTRFEPNTVCSRAYIVTFLYRAYNS